MVINKETIHNMFVGYKVVFNNAFSGAESHFQKIAMLVPSAASEETYTWLGNNTVIREWVGDRVIQNLKAHGYTIKNQKFESTVSIKREDVEDDKYGLFAPMVQQLGQNAKQHPDKLIFRLLKNGFNAPCYDGQSFFDTDHPVENEQGEVVSVSNFGGGTGEPWFLIDASNAVKPFIFQERRKYTFVSLDKENDENVFYAQRVHLWGRCAGECRVWPVANGLRQQAGTE